MSVLRAELEAAVNSTSSKAERIQRIGALLWKATGEEATIVGGSAIELLTEGRTSSDDIDIVSMSRNAGRTLESWGFVKRGRVWRREDWNLEVDIVSSWMAGSYAHRSTVETPFGPVKVIGVEDLIVKRLAELKGSRPSKWRRELVSQIEILLLQFGDRLDGTYLAETAHRERVSDILADFRRRVANRTEGPP